MSARDQANRGERLYGGGMQSRGQLVTWSYSYPQSSSQRGHTATPENKAKTRLTDGPAVSPSFQHLDPPQPEIMRQGQIRGGLENWTWVISAIWNLTEYKTWGQRTGTEREKRSPVESGGTGRWGLSSSKTGAAPMAVQNPAWLKIRLK